jgi:hypothetical protein
MKGLNGSHLLMAAVACVIALTLTMMCAQAAYAETLAENTKPTFQFLKAAAFFYNGVERELEYITDNGTTADNAIKDKLANTIYMVDGGGDPCLVHILDVGFQATADINKMQSLKATHINFRKLPSPHAFDAWQQSPGPFYGRMTVTTYWEMNNLSADAICETGINFNNGAISYPNKKCLKSVHWNDDNENASYRMQRRLKALDYIRKNFCMGLPEPNGY